MINLDAYWDFLVDNGIATADELTLVTNINGYSEKTLKDVLFCQTGNRSVEQYCDDNEIELPDFVKESRNGSVIIDKILEGADIRKVITESDEEPEPIKAEDIYGPVQAALTKEQPKIDKLITISLGYSPSKNTIVVAGYNGTWGGSPTYKTLAHIDASLGTEAVIKKAKEVINDFTKNEYGGKWFKSED